MKTDVTSRLDRLAFVALGSNLGNSPLILLQAMDRLEAFSEEPLLKSSLWETTPVACPAGSPRFVNAAIGLAPRNDATPESLLQNLQSLERELGRLPKRILNEPRPLDLDLLTFSSEVRAAANLTLPHPRAHTRRFVLQPLAEIAAHLIFPGQTKTVAQLLAALVSDEKVTRLD